MFRPVDLPEEVPGGLFLHSMPGRCEPLEQIWQRIRSDRVDVIVSLAAIDEAREKSPEYAEAVEAGTIPCELHPFPVDDYGVPEDQRSFWVFAQGLARRLSEGQRLLIHCGAGIGRTGTLAICVLLALGESLKAASETVRAAGSHPETAEQRELTAWCARQVLDREPGAYSAVDG